ncbi:MAG: ABATE domain-containing protein, partial [Betaproteobacteria bacterium]|nr:ABATE domain-containing protein [Betaproteobacteria bacterium]
MFIGDHAALDFLNTKVGPPFGGAESIANGAAYVHWLAAAGLIDPAEVPEFLERFATPALDRVAGEARSLREWLRRILAKPTGAHTRWRAADVAEKLNPILALDSPLRQLEISGGNLALREHCEYTRTRQLLVPIAQAIAELVTDGDPSLIKCCANQACTLWFYDRTKAHRRRFC